MIAEDQTPPDPHELNLDLEWRIGERAMAEILRELEPLRPRRLVEFGSGASSTRLAMALADASILSIEHDRGHLEETRRLAERHAPRARIAFSLRPLRPQLHGGALYVSYVQGAFPAQVDAAIIDGPPAGTRRGREACLYQIMPHLRVGGRVYLDDYEREEERTIVRNWMLAYPESVRVRELRVGHGLCVIEKVASQANPRWHLERTLDSVIAHGRWWTGGALRRIRRATSART